MKNKNELKEISLFYKELLKDVNSVSNLKTILLNSIKSSIIKLYNLGIFAKYASSDINKKEIDNSLNDYIYKKLISPLYLYINSDKDLRIINDYTHSNLHSIIYNYKKIKKGTSIFSFLLNKKQKEVIEESYLFLKMIKDENEFKEFYNSLNHTISLNTNDLNLIKEDYKTNFNRYRRYYKEILISIKLNDKKIKEIVEFENFFLPIDASILKIKNEEEDRINNIINNLNSLKKQNTLDYLKTIEIDRLSELIHGIRLNSLKNHDINNFYDLYKISEYDLSLIKGISDNSAIKIKREINNYFNNINKEMKIKLSIDDKRKENINLIKSIYSYKKGYSIIKKIEKIKEENKDNLSLFTHFKKIHNGETYFFLMENEKSQFRYDLEILNKFIKSGYKELIFKGIKLFNTEINEKEALEDYSKNPIIYINIIEKYCPNSFSKDDPFFGLNKEIVKKINNLTLSLNGLKCELRKYQEYGVKYIITQKRVLLGDEMGLGKTIEAIASMEHLKNNGETHFLVIAPASVLINWMKEIEKHSDLKPIKIHGENKEKAVSTWIKKGGVGVTTYETSKVLKLDNGEIFGMLIVDEAHYVKNPDALRTSRIKNLASSFEYILFMTGTALENKVEEMVNLISILNIDIANKIKPLSYFINATKFKEIVSPIYYRRKREQVLNELPLLIEKEEWCELNEIEERQYLSSLYSKNFMSIRRVSFDVPSLKDSTKMKRLLEIVEDAKEENRKILIFSYFRDTLTKVHDYLKDRCVDIINGSISPKRRDEIIEEFEKAESGTILCSQILAGGTGLNIQAASVVIILEPQLKPSTESQAISRSYRMGQVRNVEVFRLLTSDTIEEKINKLLKDKQNIFDKFADKSNSGDHDLKEIEINENQLNKMVDEEIKKHEKKNKILNN